MLPETLYYHAPSTKNIKHCRLKLNDKVVSTSELEVEMQTQNELSGLVNHLKAQNHTKSIKTLLQNDAPCYKLLNTNDIIGSVVDNYNLSVQIMMLMLM